MEKTKRLKVSLYLNAANFVLVTAALILASAGVKIVNADVLDGAGISLWQFFTVQSNVLAAVSSLVCAIYAFLILKGRISGVPLAVKLFKMISTAGVALTFMTVVFYLIPVTGGNWWMLFANHNIILHLIAPLIAIISFCAFEPTGEIKFYFTPLGVAHMFLYGIYYMATAYTHMEGGEIPYKYNWYLFASANVFMTVVISIMMIAASYAFTVAIWAINKKVFSSSEKARR